MSNPSPVHQNVLVFHDLGALSTNHRTVIWDGRDETWVPGAVSVVVESGDETLVK